MPTEEQHYDVHTTSKMTGILSSTLRVWEERYGWPKPQRMPNGYRTYSAFDVEQIRRVAELVHAGTPVSKVIVDGMPRLPAENGPARPATLARAIPPPASDSGRAARAKVDAAIDARDVGALCALVVAGARLRPADRLHGVYVPALAFVIDCERTKQTSKGLDRLQDALSTALGADVIDGVAAELRDRLASKPQQPVEPGV